MAAEEIDKYLNCGDPPADVERKLDGVRAFAEKAGRKLSFGIRLHVIARETTEEAWAKAERLISRLDDATIASAQKVFARMDSVGQSGMSALHGADHARLEMVPNLPTENPVKAAGSSVNSGPFGETIAGDHRPKSLASAS